MEYQNPLVSIIIPTYNRSAFTVRAVNSVLAQTYKNLESIVVDDGSTDDTQDKLLAYSNRVKYYYKENNGVCSARNVGIAHAQGEIVGLLDSDDCYLPDKVREGVEFFNKNLDYGMVHTDAFWIDSHDHILKVNKHPGRKHVGTITKHLIMKNFICNPTVMLRRECLKKVGPYDESLFLPADWDMWLRISEHYKIGYIAKPLSKYRVISNSCFNDLERTRRETMIVLMKLFDRNPDWPERLKNNAYASFHLSMAQCYLLKDNYKRMHEELSLAINKNPYGIKTHLFKCWYLLGQNNLREWLRKRIEFKIQAI